ncbi:MAG: tRNA preQ1(34) S-adenosylmethionine ribosyltransferase-isomerase QueA [Clostridiales bacterium]|nr:tRNA preQ1(34) S-adenosylmethionine ribosyltransferase-isomerase QueA [Clostridiales bacterium]
MIKNVLGETELKTSDFGFDLPKELIAQHPCAERDGARLMVLHRADKTIEHRIFRDITEYLHAGDVLVINDSKVIPARIYGEKIKDEGKGAVCEFVLLRQKELDRWEVIVRPGRRLKEGAAVSFGEGKLTAKIDEVMPDGNRIVSFDYDRRNGQTLYSILDEIGKMPLPPYITEELKNNSDYQTVYAREAGSAAAPTAGLHFTEELLDKIRAMGVDVVPVMLHVGLGTFRPVKTDNITDHVMHSEFFSVSKDSADRINAARARGGRIIAVGTTSCRTLESASDDSGIVRPMTDDTGIFIYPGYKFKAVDALITNFHLPESTLIMLVSALAGKDFVMNAYSEAIKERYRFFSFGDAMLIE